MCNYLHEPVTPIPEEGVAWKIFTKRGGKYCPLLSRNRGYYSNPRTGVGWSLRGRCGDGGFCMFMTKRLASKACVRFRRPNGPNRVVCKIAYKGGLGKFKEEHFIADNIYTIALCKWFKIIEEV